MTYQIKMKLISPFVVVVFKKFTKIYLEAGMNSANFFVKGQKHNIHSLFLYKP